MPSRLHPGKFYALPQAPQQYKQLLMMAGFDRYFQIAPCFRDEDPRADRLPGEFYQLDIEMSFVEQEDVFAAMEPVIRGVFEEFSGGKPVTPSPWPRIPYAEAMRKYGSDKPDLRNPIVMQNVSEHFRGSGFKVFARLLETPKNEVWAIPAPGGGQRTFADRMNAWAQGEGQPGLGYILFFDRARDETSLAADPKASGVGGRGPLANNIGPERVEAIRVAARAQGGRRGVLRRGRSGQVRQVRGARAHESGAGAQARRREPLRIRLDRRFPDVRVERRREEDRLLAQPVLDAAGRARGADETGPARRSRRFSTTSPAMATSSPRAASATIGPRRW